MVLWIGLRLQLLPSMIFTALAELELLAVILTQLGDTLATIAFQRGLCSGK